MLHVTARLQTGELCCCSLRHVTDMQRAMCFGCSAVQGYYLGLVVICSIFAVQVQLLAGQSHTTRDSTAITKLNQLKQLLLLLTVQQ
jgi:hypothetical protein